MKYYTLQDVMALHPCHKEDKLLTYMEGRKRISLSGILNSKASDVDKIWLTVRLMPVDKAVEFAKWCADSVKHLGNIYAADHAAAYAADAAAADAAAYAYAAAAARSAAAAAADVYTAAAAADVYTAAAARAARAAARAAARKVQVNKLKELVKD
jgi:hypothetical protein